MSLTFQDIWQLLNDALNAINSFFSDLANVFADISNTGQGILAGLTAFGSFIWDGLTKLADALKFLWTPLIPSLDDIAKFFNDLASSIYTSLTNIANSIFRFNEWIYNGVVWMGQQIVSLFEDVINYFMGLLMSVWNQLNTWFSDLSNTTNAWFTDFALGFRRKLQLLLIIEPAYLGFERAFRKFVDDPNGTRLRNVIVAPLVGALAGGLMSIFLDSITPNPNTKPVTILPALRLPSMPSSHLDVRDEQPVPPEGASSYELNFSLTQGVISTNNFTDMNITLTLSQGIGMV